MNKSLFIQKALECVGTEHHFQGRLPQVGLDCVGLLVVCARAAGIVVNDIPDYGHRFKGDLILAKLIEHQFVQVREAPIAGDILIFWYMEVGVAQHIGVMVSDTEFIHDYTDAGKVVKSTLSDHWTSRIMYTMRFPHWQQSH